MTLHAGRSLVFFIHMGYAFYYVLGMYIVLSL